MICNVASVPNVSASNTTKSQNTWKIWSMRVLSAPNVVDNDYLTSTADRYSILMLCKASDTVWSARMVAKWPTQFYGDGRSDGDRSVGSSAGRAGREGKVGVLTTWFACLSLHGRTDDSFYIVTIIIIITSSQWSCSRPHPSYWWYNRSKASLLLGKTLLK